MILFELICDPTTISEEAKTDSAKYNEEEQIDTTKSGTKLYLHQPIVAEEIKQEVPMTFGVPDSVLIAHDIDPSVLEFLPEDMRIELLQPI